MVRNEMLSTPERRGRPRDARVDAAVLSATVEILGQVGYSALSLSAVAERAGTTTPAIYRRWPSKAVLVNEAVFPDVTPDVVPFTSELETDVRKMVAGCLAMFGLPEVRAAMPALMAEVFADPTLHHLLLERFRGAVWQRLRDRLALDDVRVGTDADQLIEVMAGTALMALALRPMVDLGEAWVDGLTSLILNGIRPNREEPA